MKHKSEIKKVWLTARLDLLKAEKDVAKPSHEVARMRQEQWVRIDKECGFKTDQWSASKELFGGRSQIVYQIHVRPRLQRGLSPLLDDGDAFNGAKLDVLTCLAPGLQFSISKFIGEQLRDGPEYNFRCDEPAMNIETGGMPVSGPAEFVAISGTDPGTYTHTREDTSAFVLEAASSTIPIRIHSSRKDICARHASQAQQ